MGVEEDRMLRRIGEGEGEGGESGVVGRPEMPE